MPLTLPPGLHSFLVNAPAVPFVDGNSAPVHTPAQPVAPVVVGLAPLPITSAAPPLNTSFVPSSAPFPEPPVAQKISAAFDHMEPPVQQISTHKDETIDMEVMSTTDALKQVAKKAIEAHGQSIEANGRALSNMQQIKQKLATDRISLEASLSNSISAHNETNAKLQATNEEIVRLQQELHELRVKLDQSLKQQAGSQVQYFFHLFYLLLD